MSHVRFFESNKSPIAVESIPVGVWKKDSVACTKNVRSGWEEKDELKNLTFLLFRKLQVCFEKESSVYIYL